MLTNIQVSERMEQATTSFSSSTSFTNSAFYSEAIFAARLPSASTPSTAKITDHGRSDAAPTSSHRGITVSKLFSLEPLGLASSEKQIPQIVETNRSAENSEKLWKPPGCAQGRCATRLRYAPTFCALLILDHFRNFRYSVLRKWPLSQNASFIPN